MNKKVTTLLFILGGTLLNLILMGTFSIGLWILSYIILRNTGISGFVAVFVQVFFVFGGLILAYVVYTRIQKFIQKKFDLEKYLTPLFGNKKR